MKKVFSVSFVASCLASAGVVISLTSCSGLTDSKTVDISSAYRPASGSVVTVAGPVGPVTVDPADQTSKLYGLTGGSFGRQLQISLETKKATLLENGSVVLEAPILDTQSLAAGSYAVTLKQQDPLWYAPDSYYQERQLPVPSSGDKDRYLRGAFGSYALFLDSEKVLHAGDYALENVPGIRLSSDVLAKVFSTLDAGDSVVIK